MIWVCFRIKDPQKQIVKPSSLQKKPNQGSLDPLCRLDQYPVENEWLRLNPSRHSSLGQACEGLTVIGQDSKRMPNVGSCELMSRHLPGCLGGTPQHATLCTTRCVSCLVELVLRIMSGDWLQGFRLESHALLPMLCNLSPHTGS